MKSNGLRTAVKSGEITIKEAKAIIATWEHVTDSISGWLKRRK